MDNSKSQQPKETPFCKSMCCQECFSFAECSDATVKELAEAKALYEIDKKDEKALARYNRAKKDLMSAENSLESSCGEFKPAGKIPKEVESAITLVAGMTEGCMELFQWKLDKLVEKRELEEELGVSIGKPFFNAGGKEIGIVVDLDKSKIRVKKPDGKYVLIKLKVEEEEEGEGESK